MGKQTAHIGLVGILTAFVVVASAYAYVTLTFEAPDEIYHYDHVRSLVNTGRQPVLEAGSDQRQSVPPVADGPGTAGAPVGDVVTVEALKGKIAFQIHAIQ